MALKQAKELDEYYEKEGKTVGPLHGLPISLKVCWQYVSVDLRAVLICDRINSV